MMISTNAYRWSQHYEAQGMSLDANLDEALGMAAEAGLEAWEPFWETEAQRDLYAEKLPRYGLAMPSFYTPANLIGPDPEAEVARVVERCRWARELGATIVVTNPDPVNWTGTPKPDQLVIQQTAALRTLCQEVSALGMKVGLHFHTPELMLGAREVHHTFLEIPPSLLGMCFDYHWAWRGCGNSHLAADTLVRMYGDRIISLHIRQSQGGIWTETLGDGDLDYGPLFRGLRARGWSGVVTEEQAYEEGTPVTLSQIEAHRQSVAWLRDAWTQADPAMS